MFGAIVPKNDTKLFLDEKCPRIELYYGGPRKKHYTKFFCGSLTKTSHFHASIGH